MECGQSGKDKERGRLSPKRCRSLLQSTNAHQVFADLINTPHVCGGLKLTM